MRQVSPGNPSFIFEFSGMTAFLLFKRKLLKKFVYKTFQANVRVSALVCKNKRQNTECILDGAKRSLFHVSLQFL